MEANASVESVTKQCVVEAHRRRLFAAEVEEASPTALPDPLAFCALLPISNFGLFFKKRC